MLAEKLTFKPGSGGTGRWHDKMEFDGDGGLRGATPSSLTLSQAEISPSEIRNVSPTSMSTVSFTSSIRATLAASTVAHGTTLIRPLDRSLIAKYDTRALPFGLDRRLGPTSRSATYT
jgi:hypothetical protein